MKHLVDDSGLVVTIDIDEDFVSIKIAAEL
jgi:hypothetical protein